MRTPNVRVTRTRSSASPPRSPLTRYPLGRVALMVIALATPGIITSAEEPVVEAELSAWCGTNWRAEVYQSGYAHLRVHDGCISETDQSTLIRLSEAQIESIRIAVERFRFCKLPERIEPETFVTDEEVIFITSRFPGLACGVSGFGLERYPNADVVERFNEILCAISGVVPGIPE